MPWPVKSESKRWYVVLTVEQSEPEPLSATGSVVGIARGIASFLLTPFNGQRVANPRNGGKATAKLEPHSSRSAGAIRDRSVAARPLSR
ncbi:hypothetical protein [Streptomyces sp. NBC_01320]|uniref:hypothetical protein n=1 Tax=Streptomyces sp. NBC_01320 TaxID=2903824 RepID=UPI002E12385F|nr:hypothetical protein OG395_56570 [Streptomyces sp. NBC_01320]